MLRTVVAPKLTSHEWVPATAECLQCLHVPSSLPLRSAFNYGISGKPFKDLPSRRRRIHILPIRYGTVVGVRGTDNCLMVADAGCRLRRLCWRD